MTETLTDPIVRLESDQLAIEPGGQVQTSVTVQNLGTIVEGYRLEVLGTNISEWGEINPPELRVFPNQEVTAVVTLSPPATAQHGSYPFAIRAESQVNQDSSALAEGDLQVSQVHGLQSKLTPVSTVGRWRGKHDIELTNWGNSPVRLHLVAQDPDDRLAFLIGPETIDLPLGVSGHAQLRVKSKKPFLRGSQVRLPFQVVAEPDDVEASALPATPFADPRRAVLDGVFNQRPILSRLVVVVAIAAVLACCGLAAWALTRDRSTPAAELRTGAPLTPEMTAFGADASSIQLLWKGQPNIQNYKIHQLTADGQTADVKTIDGALETYPVKELPPDTEYCFQLEAIRDNQSSPFSATACARTAAAAIVAASPSVTESPSISAGAEPTQPATSAPNAPSDSGIPSENAPASEPAGGTAPSSEAGPTPSSAPAVSSPPAESGSGTPNPLPKPAFTAEQFINVVFPIPQNDVQALTRAQGKQQEFNTAGVPAQLLASADFPDLRFGASAVLAKGYLIYVGPFDTREKAQAYCAAKPASVTMCYPAQPNPNG